MSKTLPIVAVLDQSGSMSSYGRIGNLSKGFRILVDSLEKNPKAKNAARMKLVTFTSDVNVGDRFLPIENFKNVQFTANGGTSLFKAIKAAYETTVDYVTQARRNGGKSPCYLPHIIIITDGLDNNMDPKEVEEVKRLARLHAGEKVHGETSDILIAPYIIYATDDDKIGFADAKTKEETKKALVCLDEIAEPFQGQALVVSGEKMFRDMFAMISGSITASAGAGGRTLKEILASLRTEIIKEVVIPNRVEINKRYGIKDLIPIEWE